MVISLSQASRSLPKIFVPVRRQRGEDKIVEVDKTIAELVFLKQMKFTIEKEEH